MVIFDTNIWISYTLFPGSSLSSVVGQAPEDFVRKQLRKVPWALVGAARRVPAF